MHLNNIENKYSELMIQFNVQTPLNIRSLSKDDGDSYEVIGLD